MRLPPLDVIERMLQSARLTEPQAAERLTHAVDVDYWRGLAPDLHVIEPAPLESASIDEEAFASTVATFRADGVFHVKRALASGDVARLNHAVQTVVHEGWPAVFTFVYDEFWQCARHPAVARVIAAALGPEYRQIPHIWTHVVQPVAGAAGWAPHVDGNRPNRMTAWVALTDATLANGCMHFVPRSVAPEGFPARFYEKTTFTHKEMIAALHATRPLPAAAGDVLGWAFDVVHWGGHVQPPAAARRSISMEFIAKGERPASDETPLLPLDRMPSWNERLRAIAAALLEYRKFQPAVGRFEDVARRILAKVGDEGSGRLEPANQGGTTSASQI